MKVGDLVKWIGFPGADETGVKVTGPVGETGIIIAIYQNFLIRGKRIDVSWSSGKIGLGLYPETLEVINEC